MLRRALVALSLANLCFIPAWREVLDPGPLFHCYHTKICPVGATILGVTFDVLLLAVLFFVGFELARRSRHPLALKAAYAAFLLAAIFPLNGLRIQFPALMTPRLIAALGLAGFGLVGLALVALVLVAVWRFGLARLARGAATVFLILSPFLVVAYAQSLYRLVSYRRAMPEQAAVAPPAPQQAPRVVWIIFDELDYRVAFGERPATLQLPEFDRLRAQSVFAGEAYPPAGFTVQSIPAFVSGRLVADAKQTRPDELVVKFHEEAEGVVWGTRPSLFARARELGRASAVIGWHHPYCRIFGRELVQCMWKEDTFSAEAVVLRSRVKDNMLRDARISFLSLPVLHRLLPRAEEDNEVDPRLLKMAADDYQEMVEQARKISTDPGIQLAFVHLPVPHPPGFYDRARGEVAVHRKNSYADSLALADRTLGEVRRAMEEAGVWDGAAVIVSSDHWWRAREVWDPDTGDPEAKAYWHPEDETMLPRADDYRVPFLLKLPGQQHEAAYAPPFNTVLSHDLVLSLLRGENHTPEAVAGWLDAHRSFGVSPYNNLLFETMRAKKYY